MITIRVVAAFGYLGLLLVAGCSNVPVTVEKIEPDEFLEAASASAATHDELSWHSQRLLYGYGVDLDEDTDPQALLDELEPKLRDSGSWQDKMVLAELLLLAAKDRTPADVAKYYVDALEYASDALFSADGPTRYDPRATILLSSYNVALARMFSARQEQDGHPKSWKTMQGRTKSHPLRIDGDWHSEDFDRFVVSDTLKFEGTGPRHRAFGIGAPVVALNSRAAKSELAEYYPSQGMVVPMTVLLYDDKEREGVWVLALENPLEGDSFVYDGQSLPLAADFTAPVACFVAGVDVSQYDNAGFFSPASQSMPQGLKVLQPYDRNKIPVVLVHGLWSNPVMWRYMINAILGDPELRYRYQIWVYLYSTGLPIMINSALMRRSLDEARVHFDPEGDDPATRDVVMVGHSMGGLLSGSTVRDAGTVCWDYVFTVPPEQVRDRLDKEPKLEELLLFKPREYVSRVIFMNTPHGGSLMSETFVGRLGDFFITPPKTLIDWAAKLRKDFGDVYRDEAVFEFSSSVDTLSPNNKTLRLLRSLPMREGVRFHSVIGQIEAGPLEESSDGVVPYGSAHLDGAASELVIRSDHSGQITPPGIAEVRRILRLHLEEKDAAQQPKR